jgi:uncharacterized protein Yka (UPF0111/DUF47 family)
MTTYITADNLQDAMYKLTNWREELEKQVPLGNMRKSGKLIRQYARTKDETTLMEAIMKLEFEIDWIARKQGKVLLQEEMQWTLAG